MGGTKGLDPKNSGFLKNHISNHYNFCFLTSGQVILISSCCLFCVLSNDMLNVSIGFFSLKIHVPTSRLLINLYHQSPADTHPCMNNKILKLLCDFPKPVISYA